MYRIVDLMLKVRRVSLDELAHFSIAAGEIDQAVLTCLQLLFYFIVEGFF